MWDVWEEAVKIRQEWLGHSLCTQPADRASAEHHLTAIYARIGRRPPRFVWVDSPSRALPLIAGLPTLDQLYAQVRDWRPTGRSLLAGDLALVASRLRVALSNAVRHPDPELSPVRKTKRGDPWPYLPPGPALQAGVPLGVVLHQGIRLALYRSVSRGIAHRIRDALAVAGPVPLCWYGQQDTSWIAYYDALQRLGLAGYGTGEAGHLQHWAGLARSCGWWWPGEDVCVVVERPVSLHAEAIPRAWHGEVRLSPGGVRYRDGWSPSVP